MARVGVICVDEGDSCAAEVVGLPQDGETAYEVVDVDLTEEQAGRVAAAWGVYTGRVAHALELIQQAQRTIRDARAAYDEAVTAWLQPLHQQAIEDEEAVQHAAWVAKAEARAREEQARLEAQDARLGPRQFVKVERPARETRKYAWGEAARWRLHVQGCQFAADVTRDNREGIRMDDACDLYADGALACGRCKPDNLMAADAVNGERIRAARTTRESKTVTVTQHQLKDAVRTVPWKLGNRPGLVMMSTQTFEIPAGAAVVGWRDPADSFGRQIPQEHREAVYQAAASRRGWQVRWNEQPQREGYLIVRAKTKAEIRQERGA